MRLAHHRGPSRSIDSILLWAGIAIRVGTFLLMPLENPDSSNHLAYARAIHDTHRLPITQPCNQTYHPPLYHVLASLSHAAGGMRAIEALSLVLSLATFALYHRLLLGSDAVGLSRESRRVVVALLAVLPQFVQFGLFVSNDPLAIFLGAVIALLSFRFAREPGGATLSLIAVTLVLGLLTKYSFLVFPPLVCVFVFCRMRRAGRSLPRAALACAGVLLACVTLGLVKPWHNLAHGVPAFASNLDRSCAWVSAQSGVYLDFVSFHSFRLLALLASPALSSESQHSFPTMLYATFWAPHWDESRFATQMLRSAPALIACIYALALPATLVFAAGALCMLRRGIASLRHPAGPGAELARPETLALLLFLASLLLVYVATRVHDVWSVQQARLLFPAILGGMLAFGEGLDRLRSSRGAAGRRAIRLYIAALLLSLVGYSLVSFARELWQRAG